MPISLISKIKPQNNGLFPMYDDIDGYGGYQVRLNTADRDSIPTLNRKAGMLVYTQAERSFWQLNPDLVTWSPALSTVLQSNPFWLQTTWFIDPHFGNNHNDGLTSSTPIQTWAELIRRWGTYSPILSVAVTVTFLLDQTSNADPLFANPVFTDSGSLTITGTLVQMTSGSMFGVVPKNRAATGVYPAGLLQANLGAGVAAGHDGYLLFNTTRDGYCWINSHSGDVATLTQPFVPNVPTYSDFPAEVDNFSNGDNFVIFRPTQIFVDGLLTNSSPNVNQVPQSYNLSHVWVMDPIGIGRSTAVFSHIVRITEARIDTATEMYIDPLSTNSTHINVWAPGGAVFLGATIIGGAFGTLLNDFSSVSFSGVCDADVIFRGPTVIFDIKDFGLTTNEVSCAYFDNTQVIAGLNITQINGDTRFGFSNVPGGCAYGQYIFDLFVVSNKITYGGTAASNFQGTPTLRIDGTSFANAYDPSTVPAQWYPGRVLTVANLDATVAAGGFGGIAVGDGGAVITNGVQSGSSTSSVARAALGPVRFIDPSNSTGFANDGYTGATSNNVPDGSGPILTTSRLNTLLFNKRLTADTTITYMSDDPGTVGLDYSTMDLVTFGLTFQGTRQVLHTGGTLDTGTVAINPLANQRQIVHTSDLSTFSPYVISSLGGSAPHPAFLMDTTGGNNGTSAWIVSVDGYPVGDGYMSRPITAGGDAGTLAITNNYLIARGSILNVAEGTSPVQSGGSSGSAIAFFNDFAFGSTHWGIGVAQYTRCSFDATIVTGGGFTNCFCTTGIIEIDSMGNVVLTAGVLVTTPFDELIAPLTLQKDVYVTGDSFILSTDSYSAVFLTPTSDGYGAQFQDMTSGDGAIQVYTVTGFGCGTVDAAGGADALIWGTNNVGPGIAIGPGATLSVAGGNHIADPRSTPPIVTGAAGDFVFVDGLGSRVATGRSWDEVGNKYNAPAATTWANFINPNVFNFQAHNVASGASIVAVPRALGPAGPAKAELGPVRFIDPSNVTTLASDKNDGATSTTPILTTVHLNDLLFQRQISTSVTITYLSDDTSGTLLDFSTLLITSAGKLTFVGTPQVLHTGGTLNSGTIAINPLAPGGGQRQTAHTSDLVSFAPYVLTSLGGTADHPTYIIDTTGGNTGNSAWIVSGLGATASLSRPMDTTFIATGALTIGDSYRIQRGSLLAIGGSVTVGFAPAPVVFTDFAFTSNGLRTPGSFSPFFNRCSTDTILFSSGFFPHCFAANDLDFSSPGYLLWAGVWLLTGGNTGEALVELAADVYVRDTPAFAQAIRCDQNGQGNVAVFEGSGSGGLGAQFQDISHPTAALIICSSPIICTGANGDALIWGNGNDGYGIAIAPNGLATVPTTGPFIPNITGALGDFCFIDGAGNFVSTGRSWDEVNNKYNVPANTTWANFANPDVFNFQAHDVAINASIVGTPRTIGPTDKFALFVDPQNVTTLASDSNDGQTSTTPILTTAENNARIARIKPSITSNTTITYLSEDLQAVGANPVGIALGPMHISATLTIEMTPIITRSTSGTFVSGTIAIDPAALHGGQRQIGQVSDIASWTPFVFNLHGLGGSSTVPQRIIDTTTNASAWIVDGYSGAQVSLSRPTDPTITSSPAITIGNHYHIQRPGVVMLADGPPPTLNAGGSVVFNDCAFAIGSVPLHLTTSFVLVPTVYNHCAFLGGLSEGGTFNDCYMGDGACGTYFANMNAGVWLNNGGTDGQAGLLVFNSDTYMTGDFSLNIGRSFYQCVEVGPGFGAGLQIQSISTEASGVFYQQGGTLALFGLLWGNGHPNVGIAMGPGTTLTVPSAPIFPNPSQVPSITGISGDFWFELNSSAITKARTWNNATGAYTEAGGVATRDTTWNNLTTSIAGGGFQGSCVSLEAQSAIVMNS